jgi:hypothetical protein
MDWFGSFGGIHEILLQLITVFLGGYSLFHSQFATIASLYKV